MRSALFIILLTVVYENFFEWWVHKYLLHGLGKNRASFWSFHWIDHHSKARRNGFIDPDYANQSWSWNSSTKELAALLAGGIIHLPLLLISPLAYGTLVACGIWYYSAHRWSHTHPAWANKHLSWHWDHHMGPDQNRNWCVTWPLTDWILGTRKKD